MEWLSGECHEAVLLAAYDYRKGAMMFVDVIQAPHPLQWSVDLNEWMPVHSGATGRAILSFLPKEERERIYAGQLDQVTSRTVTQADRLEELVAETLRDGYALSSGERVIGAVGIGAPVFDSEGYVFGDVCITIPEGRFSEENVTRLTTSLKMAAEKISTALRRSGFLAPRRIDAHSEP